MSRGACAVSRGVGTQSPESARDVAVTRRALLPAAIDDVQTSALTMHKHRYMVSRKHAASVCIHRDTDGQTHAGQATLTTNGKGKSPIVSSIVSQLC